MPEDPRSAGPRPPFPRQPPGAALSPAPDHGERTYRGSGRLAGCVALVTESDSGIGRAVAIAFAREGADIVIAYLREHADADETARWVRQAGRRALVVAGDVREARHHDVLMDRTTAELGHLDILVNNTAFEWAHEPAANASATEVEEALRTSSESVFFLAKTAAARMPPGGSIIATSAIRSRHPAAHARAYATHQQAIDQLTASLAQTLVERGIRMNVVAPGPVWTPRILSSLPPEEVRDFGAETLLGRPAQPAELAPAYVFLASEEARFITGAVLAVTGGRTEPPARRAPQERG